MFEIVKSFDQLLKVYAVRAIVFCEEQRIPYALEVDEHDQSSLHILGTINQEPIAAGRIRLFSECAKFERLAIRKAYRGEGYGNQLLHYMMAVARDRGFSTFRLNAQRPVKSFYEQQGFEVCGEEFMEADIPHYPMVMSDVHR